MVNGFIAHLYVTNKVTLAWFSLPRDIQRFVRNFLSKLYKRPKSLLTITVKTANTFSTVSWLNWSLRCPIVCLNGTHTSNVCIFLIKGNGQYYNDSFWVPPQFPTIQIKNKIQLCPQGFRFWFLTSLIFCFYHCYHNLVH